MKYYYIDHPISFPDSFSITDEHANILFQVDTKLNWGRIIKISKEHQTLRILDDKINGVYVRKIDTNSQFLFGNIRYFVLSLGEGIGTYLSGYLIQISFRSIFLGAAVFTILQIIL